MTGITSSVDARVAVSKGEESPLVFRSLTIFLFILFVAPQAILTFLIPLQLAKVSAIVALGAYIYQQRSCNKAILPRGSEFPLLGLFLVMAVLSIPFSLWPGGSLGLLTDFYSKSLIIGLLIAQTLTSMSRFKQLLRYLMVFLVIDCFIALRGFEAGEVVEGYRLAGALAPLTSNPNDFALILNLILPYGLAFFLFARRGMHKLACAVFLVTAGWTILVTYSRGGFITFVVIVIAFAAMTAPAGKKFWYLALAIFGLCAILVISPEGFGDRILSSVGLAKDRSGSAEARKILNEKTLEIIAEHPILGVGIGMNILALNDKGVFWTGVHNVYLQIASDMGVPASVVFVLLLVRLYKGIPATPVRRPDAQVFEMNTLAVATKVSLIGFAVAAMFHPVAYHFYFYIAAGFAIAIRGIVLQKVAESERIEGLAQPVRERLWWNTH